MDAYDVYHQELTLSRQAQETRIGMPRHSRAWAPRCWLLLLDLIHEINEEDIASIPVHPVVSLRVRLLHLLGDGKSRILEISNILI